MGKRLLSWVLHCEHGCDFKEEGTYVGNGNYSFETYPLHMSTVHGESDESILKRMTEGEDENDRWKRIFDERDRMQSQSSPPDRANHPTRKYRR